MRRKRLLISVGLIFGFLLMVLVGLIVMVKREPSFYHQASMADSPERVAQSNSFISEFGDLRNSLVNFEPNWEVEFTNEQLNAYFQEHYYQQGGDENLPDGWHAPRVKLEDGKIRIGIRYGQGIFSTILSLEIRFWLVPNQTNVLAMEIVSFQAGSLPISTGTLLDQISAAARREHIDVTWYRKDGHPVALMKFQSDLTRPTFQFSRVELQEGKVIIAGRDADRQTPPPRVVKP